MPFSKLIHLISLFILACSCSFSKSHQAARSVANDFEEKPSHIFRFYGKHEYLPKVIRVYERKFYAPVELSFETEVPKDISCKGFAGLNSEVFENYIFSSTKLTITLGKNISFVDCTYSGANQHDDLKVSYELINFHRVCITGFFSSN